MLRSQGKGSPCAVLRCRCKVILGLVQGKSPTQLADGGLCSVSQVYRVADRFVEEGPAGLADRREDNGDAKVDESYACELFHVLAKTPRDFRYRRPTWTQELLILVLAERTGVRVSCTTMCRLLKRRGIRLRRPKPVVGCPWKKSRRLRRLRAIRRLAARPPRGEVVVYVDEVDIHLNPKIGPDWTLPGRQQLVLTPGKNHKHYLAGALDARSGRLTWVEGSRKTSELFILLIWRLLRDYPQAKRIHVVLDNFKIHSSRQTQLALAAAGDRIKLHFLPPYCPDANRIERVWKDLHDNVTRNHRCRTLRELLDEVRAYLQTRRRALQHAYATHRAA